MPSCSSNLCNLGKQRNRGMVSKVVTFACAAAVAAVALLGHDDNNGGDNEKIGIVPKVFIAVAAAMAAKALFTHLFALFSAPNLVSEPEVAENDDGDEDECGFTHHQNDVVWRFPLDDGWVKCNVDASGPRKIGASSGCAVVFRGASGNWLYGFSKSLDDRFCNSSTAELAAIHFGLEKARELSHRKLILECDFRPGVDVVNKKDGACASAAEKELVQKICSLVNHISYVKVTHIPHKENLVAHRLAREARSFPLGTVHSVDRSTLEYYSIQ